MSPKYSAPLALFLNGMRVAASEKFTLAFGVGVYCMYVLIFSAIWKHTAFTPRGGQDINFVSMVWYIASTESVTFSGVQFREQVRIDISSQQISGLMGRPLPYWLLRMAQLLGRGALHFTLLTAAGLALGFWITGHLPYQIGNGALLLPLIMGMILTLVACFVIGMLDVWGQYARPAYWIWQKALFVMGGLMLPLSLYPEWLHKAALWTPFPAMSYLPALLMLQHNAAALSDILLVQLFWLVVLLSLALLVHRAAKRHIGAVGD